MGDSTPLRIKPPRIKPPWIKLRRTGSVEEDIVVGNQLSNDGDLQGDGLLFRGIVGDMALVAVGRCVGGDDQPILPTTNPGLLFRGGKGDVGEAR